MGIKVMSEIKPPESKVPTWAALVAMAKSQMTATQFKKWKQEAQRALFHGKLDGKAAKKARGRARS